MHGRKVIGLRAPQAETLGDQFGQTSRLWTTAARTKSANRGWGAKGRDFSSGWYYTPMNHGWSSRSTVSGSTPSGDRPAIFSPVASMASR